MFRFCGRIITSVVVMVAGLATDRSQAQDAVIADLYGSGVHSYFSGNLQQSLDDLTAAIDTGSKDPRAYYFRGLVERRLGMEGNAEDDFARGAELEANAADRFYPVSRSLERIQGSERLAIERHRAKARAIAYQLNQNREQQRYQRIQRAEEEVLRDVESAPAAEALPPANPAAAPNEPAVKAPAEADPFAEPAAEPKPAAEPAEADPFADEPATEKAPAEEMPAEDDPFAGGTDKAEAEAPAPKAEADDPFAAGAEEKPADEKPAPKAEADGDDPFAAGEDKPAAEEKPKADEAAEDDPFADDAAAEEPKADEKPADEKPAEKEEMEEDPFS